jgi:pantoate--beta-alanine ligase
VDSVNRIHTVRERVAAWRGEGLSVGLVPTMGNLHRGHLALLQLALERAARVVVSIFVNPLQFGAGEDLDRYPRTLEHDREALAREGAHLLFVPTDFEMYPVGFERSTVVDVGEFSGILEGQSRPGHFVGVATVVTKLFNIVMPDIAVFGEKDYQQLVVVGRLVRDLCLPIEIVAAPTVRDPDGLALSSRNQYLSRGERRRAPRLHEVLRSVRERILDGAADWEALEAEAFAALVKAGFEPDYVSVRRAADLLPPRAGDHDFVVLAAARLGKTRLIDNVRARSSQP